MPGVLRGWAVAGIGLHFDGRENYLGIYNGLDELALETSQIISDDWRYRRIAPDG